MPRCVKVLSTLLFLQLEKNEGAPFWRLLNIFAYGRYSDYKGRSPGVLLAIV